MSTVKEYANVLNIPSQTLIKQLVAAGVDCKEGDRHVITEDQKQKLLNALSVALFRVFRVFRGRV